MTKNPAKQLKAKSQPEMVNLEILNDGTIRPRKSFATFAGMVYQLWLINKRFTKMGIVGDFTVRLPLPGKFKYGGGAKHEK